VSRLMLPVERHEHARACQPCEGGGVTGERYEMTTGPHVLLLEVICPACGGCGNGDPRHPGCKPEWHAYPEDDGWDTEDGGDEDDPACWSCGSGRGWNVAQGFSGEGDGVEMVLTRVPCGCSESRLVEAGDG
jgi:hypothetical protein